MSNKRFHDTKGEVMGLQNRSNQTDHSHAPKSVSYTHLTLPTKARFWFGGWWGGGL